MSIWTSKKLWKMVDAEHADAVSSGRLRVGPLQGFADLENGRADALDGGVRIRSGVIASDLSDPRDVAHLRKFGFNARQAPGPAKMHVLAENLVSETRIRNCWAFCATEVGNTHDFNPAVEKAIFEIADAEAMLRRMWPHLARHCVDGSLAWIKYEPRDVLVQDSDTIAADPLVKDPFFAIEEEARYLFRGPSGRRAKDALWTQPDPHISRLLRRLSQDEIDEAAASYEPKIRTLARQILR